MTKVILISTATMKNHYKISFTFSFLNNMKRISKEWDIFSQHKTHHIRDLFVCNIHKAYINFLWIPFQGYSIYIYSSNTILYMPLRFRTQCSKDISAFAKGMPYKAWNIHISFIRETWCIKTLKEGTSVDY
jgi:hypothetical protein